MSGRSTPEREVEQFEYETSLTDSESPAIRLIVLLPEHDGDDDGGGEIKCTLAKQCFENCPPYEALSYTWGNPQDQASIICNGQSLSITSSLYRILLHLRGQEQRVLWIDQISINQVDDREKTQQVAMMRDIYRQSERTIAWLGDPLSSTEKGFETLHRLSQARITISNLPGNENWLELDNDDPHGYKTLQAISRAPEKFWGVARPDRMEMNAVLSVLRSPWFTRIWIVQEAAVARNLIVQSGHHSIPASYLILSYFILQTMVDQQSVLVNLLSRGGYQMMETLAVCRYAYQKADSMESSLIILLCRCRQFQATDQRDRLFALYGLTSSSLPDLDLVPDYTVDARDALCSGYFKLMRNDRSLRLLELVESSAESDLPSWVPHQRIARDPKLYPLSELHRIEHSSRELTIMGIYQDIFTDQIRLTQCADGNPFDTLVADFHAKQKSEQEMLNNARLDLDLELRDHYTLCIKGQFLDRIAQLSAVILEMGTTDQGGGKITRDFANYLDFEGLEEPDADASALENFKAMREGFGMSMRYVKMQFTEVKRCLDTITDMDSMVMSKKQTAYYKSESAIFTAYRDTVSAGSLKPEHGAELNHYGWTETQSDDQFRRWRGRLAPAFQIDDLKKRLGWNRQTGILSLLAAGFRNRASADFDSIKLGAAMHTMFGRRLAWTARGHLALVPAQTAVDDHVFALRGSSMLFVLQSQLNNWKILGPTYVDGMMNGELLDEDAIGTIRLV